MHFQMLFNGKSRPFVCNLPVSLSVVVSKLISVSSFIIFINHLQMKSCIYFENLSIFIFILFLQTALLRFKS